MLGVDARHIGDNQLTLIMSRHMKTLGISEPTAYLTLLDRSEKELQALIELLVVPESLSWSHASACCVDR